jgi:hypothetical protein
MDMDVAGFVELQQLIEQLGKVPQKVATKAAGAGARIDLTATKADAPVYDGWLKASLKMVGERASKPGKKYMKSLLTVPTIQSLLKRPKRENDLIILFLRNLDGNIKTAGIM